MNNTATMTPDTAKATLRIRMLWLTAGAGAGVPVAIGTLDAAEATTILLTPIEARVALVADDIDDA